MPIKPTTSFLFPFAVQFELAEGTMSNPRDHIARRASDMRGYYADPQALESLVRGGDPLHY